MFKKRKLMVLGLATVCIMAAFALGGNPVGVSSSDEVTVEYSNIFLR